MAQSFGAIMPSVPSVPPKCLGARDERHTDPILIHSIKFLGDPFELDRMRLIYLAPNENQ